MPAPKKGEKQNDFVSRCMSSEESKRSFPDTKQRVAFCNSQWRRKGKGAYWHILNRAEQARGDEKAGYPPNCNKGYHEKNGKCVPIEEEKEAPEKK